MRCLRLALSVVLVVLVVGGASALAGQRVNLWAGQWQTSTGGVGFRLMTKGDIPIAKTEAGAAELFDKLPCGGPQYYRGGYSGGQDSGKVIACGTPTSLRGRYLSNINRSIAGSFSITISSQQPLKFAGTETPNGGKPAQWVGTWLKDFAGDGCCAKRASETWDYTLSFYGRTFWGHGEGKLVPPRPLFGDIVEIGCAGHGAIPNCPGPRRPVISMQVDDASLTVTPLNITPPDRPRENPAMSRTLTLKVHVITSSNHTACAIGRRGVVEVTDRDAITSTNINGSRLQVGGWDGRCDSQTFILDGLARGAVGTGSGTFPPSQFFVLAWIGCRSPSSSAFAPRYC
jgi:hypothetical protein